MDIVVSKQFYRSETRGAKLTTANRGKVTRRSRGSTDISLGPGKLNLYCVQAEFTQKGARDIYAFFAFWEAVGRSFIKAQDSKAPCRYWQCCISASHSTALLKNAMTTGQSPRIAWTLMTTFPNRCGWRGPYLE